MLLKAAVKKRCREGVETLRVGSQCSPVHSVMEADQAPLRFSKHNLPEPPFHSFLVVFVENADIVVSRVCDQCIQPSEILGIWMDIGIEKQDRDFVSFTAEVIEGYH